MKFKQWYLNEVGTGANMVAVFARPIFGATQVKRTWPPSIAGDDEEDDDDKSEDGLRKRK
jgi:hypothetical protein